jgi:hypothetical protein
MRLWGADAKGTMHYGFSCWSGRLAGVKAFELVGEASAHDGTAMKLVRRDEAYLILAGGAVLMSSRMHGSERSWPVWLASDWENAIGRRCCLADWGWDSRCVPRWMRWRRMRR